MSSGCARSPNPSAGPTAPPRALRGPISPRSSGKGQCSRAVRAGQGARGRRAESRRCRAARAAGPTAPPLTSPCAPRRGRQSSRHGATRRRRTTPQGCAATLRPGVDAHVPLARTGHPRVHDGARRGGLPRVTHDEGAAAREHAPHLERRTVRVGVVVEGVVAVHDVERPVPKRQVLPRPQGPPRPGPQGAGAPPPPCAAPGRPPQGGIRGAHGAPARQVRRCRAPGRAPRGAGTSATERATSPATYGYSFRAWSPCISSS